MTLDNDVYKTIKELSKIDNVSLSSLSEKLINEALELREDAALSFFAEKREESYDETIALGHDKFWKD